ncbi:MAG: NnrS family protein [Arenimonas sp.]
MDAQTDSQRDAALRQSLSLRVLAGAPHRLLFFVGAANVLLAMVWWTAWLAAARWPGLLPSHPSLVPAGWMHAVVMQYQVLPPFMFGFLLTVFPRWLGLEPLARRHYLPVGLGLFGGQLLTLLGLCGLPMGVPVGLALGFAGWTLALISLLGCLRREREPNWHARSCAVALLFGWVGLGLVLAYLFTGNPRLMFAAIKFGGFALLLPVYFTVNHRMTPFFTGCVFPDYRPWRPMWLLAAFWVGLVVHLSLELRHAYAWLWVVDLPMTALTALTLWRWWPRGQGKPMPGLLRVLYLGFAWLPVAFALYAAQSAWFAISGEWAFARAPAHALFIGYFGSLLVAMVTRVTQGHAGRPLELGSTAVFAFAVVQLTVLLRLAAEAGADALAWQVAAGLAWLLAFVPWVLHSGGIYLRPRTDGKPG